MSTLIVLLLIDSSVGRIHPRQVGDDDANPTDIFPRFPQAVVLCILVLYASVVGFM